MKKSYNPFKMLGSYVGALIGGLFYLYVAITVSRVPGQIPFDFVDIQLIIIHIFVGFLIGFGIHSLMRVLK